MGFGGNYRYSRCRHPDGCPAPFTIPAARPVRGADGIRGSLHKSNRSSGSLLANAFLVAFDAVMEPARSAPPAGSNCPAGGTGRHRRSFLLMFTLLLGPVNLPAQPAAGSIATRQLALPASLIDAAGNVYTAGIGYGAPSEPVTPGAAQTQPGGGVCSTIVALGPCSDAYVAKTDAAGNLVFGTFLGGQTDDSANAVAVDAAGNV